MTRMLVKGDPDYVRIHRLVRKLRGPAREQPCARCAENGIDKPAADWAQIHTEDGLDPWADYIALCKSCHAIYDQMNVGRVQSPETRAKIKATRATRTYVVTEEARQQLSRRFRGVPKSAEHRAKIGAANRGKKRSAEFRERMSALATDRLPSRERDDQGRFR